MVVVGAEMFSGLDIFFHSRRGPVFLFLYNTIRVTLYMGAIEI